MIPVPAASVVSLILPLNSEALPQKDNWAPVSPGKNVLSPVADSARWSFVIFDCLETLKVLLKLASHAPFQVMLPIFLIPSSAQCRPSKRHIVWTLN